MDDNIGSKRQRESKWEMATGWLTDCSLQDYKRLSFPTIGREVREELRKVMKQSPSALEMPGEDVIAFWDLHRK